MPSKPDSPSANPPQGAIRLRIVGMHIVAFKNTKMMSKGRLFTDPRKHEVMERIIQDFVAQLRSISVTNGSETLTGRQAHSWIVSALPLKDSRQWIPELHVYSTEVQRGQEGCEILIESL